MQVVKVGSAVWPISNIFAKLTKNTSSFSNVNCYQFGVGENVEASEINVNEASPSSSLLELAEAHKENYSFATKTHKETIQITTLDYFFKDKKLNSPVLLKVDVQGYEDKVLKGGTKVLKEVDIVHIEASFQELYKDQVLFGDLFNYLKKENFDFVGFVENSYNSDNHQLLFCNAIFKKATK